MDRHIYLCIYIDCNLFHKALDKKKKKLKKNTTAKKDRNNRAVPVNEYK